MHNSYDIWHFNTDTTLHQYAKETVSTPIEQKQLKTNENENKNENKMKISSDIDSDGEKATVIDQ